MVIGIGKTCRTMPELNDKMRDMRGKILVQYTLYLIRASGANLVKSWRAAALALVGWYLMVPPWSGPGAFNADAPLSSWLICGSFDSAVQCSHEQDRRVRNLRNAKTVEAKERAFNERLYSAAKCIASNDAGLKGN